MKKQKQQSKTAPNAGTADTHIRGSGPFPWEAIQHGFREALDWAFDVAAVRASNYRERADAVKRTRAFFRARLAGKPAHVDTEDAVFTIALVVGALEDCLTSSALVPWLALLADLPFPVASRTPQLPHVPRELSRLFASTPFTVA